MGISASAVKELRERTGTGMMDCKRALVEVDGDIEEAIKYLRTKGLSAAEKRAHRTASDGLVTIVGDAAKMAILELNCETEPVSKNPDFRNFGEALANQALVTQPADLDAFKAQDLAADAEHTVEQAVSLKVAVIGENIVLSRFSVVEAAEGNTLGSYIHAGGKIGVVVEGTSDVSNEALHDVALHVTATDPRFTRRDEVTKELLENEREIAINQAIEQGKPEDIAKKMVTGKMEKFFETEVLSEQAFAKDSSVSVGEYLKQSCGENAKVVSFVRYKLGEH
jgi:elongation factor Ts